MILRQPTPGLAMLDGRDCWGASRRIDARAWSGVSPLARSLRISRTFAGRQFPLRHVHAIRPRHKVSLPLARQSARFSAAGAGEDMRRVHAWRVVATMEPAGLVVRHWAILERPREDLGRHASAPSLANPEATVAVLVESAEPKPAFVGAANVHLRPESLLWRSSDSLSSSHVTSLGSVVRDRLRTELRSGPVYFSTDLCGRGSNQ